ncbi:TPA: YbjQ family protein [Bacillus cereus]|nr:YbjQ family protein [Bacillus cereus]
MVMVSTDTIVTREIIEVKGLVTSSVVQSRHIGKDIFANVKSIIGGELSGYTEMLEDSKKMVQERLQKQVKEIGGNAIVGLRFELAAGKGTSELIGYGTAVVLQ